MQVSIALIAIAAFASTVLASTPWFSGKGTAAISSRIAHQTGATAWTGCLTEAKASEIVTQYTYLLEHPTGPEFNSTADALLSDDFVVWSDSIEFLAGKPLNTASFTSKADFIARQARTPAIPTLTTEEIFHGCEKIAWRWTGSEMGKMASKGIITMNITDGKVSAGSSEFNTGAWLVDFNKYPCNSTS